MKPLGETFLCTLDISINLFRFPSFAQQTTVAHTTGHLYRTGLEKKKYCYKNSYKWNQVRNARNFDRYTCAVTRWAADTRWGFLSHLPLLLVMQGTRTFICFAWVAIKRLTTPSLLINRLYKYDVPYENIRFNVAQAA